MKEFASLCVLGYKRRLDLLHCIDSIHKTANFPFELIINYDGLQDFQDIEIKLDLQDMLTTKKVSKVIFNNGKNRGVGRSFQNCLGLAEGKYIFKIDADLTFNSKWLSAAVRILESDSTIGALGLFDYNKWDPQDSRFKPEENVLEYKEGYQIVKDFVSSIYGFTREKIDALPRDIPIPDDGMHQRFGKMALMHAVTNTAFGVGKSTYVSGTMDHPVKTETFEDPFLFSL